MSFDLQKSFAGHHFYSGRASDEFPSLRFLECWNLQIFDFNPFIFLSWMKCLLKSRFIWSNNRRKCLRATCCCLPLLLHYPWAAAEFLSCEVHLNFRIFFVWLLCCYLRFGKTLHNIIINVMFQVESDSHVILTKLLKEHIFLTKSTYSVIKPISLSEMHYMYWTDLILVHFLQGIGNKVPIFNVYNSFGIPQKPGLFSKTNSHGQFLFSK